MTYGRKPHVSICHRFCTIQVQSWPSIGKFPFFRVKIGENRAKKGELSLQKMAVPRSIYFFQKNFRHETFPNNILGILIEQISSDFISLTRSTHKCSTGELEQPPAMSRVKDLSH